MRGVGIWILAALMALTSPACRWFRRTPKQPPAPKPAPTAPAPAPPPRTTAAPELEPPQLPPGPPPMAQLPPPPVEVAKPKPPPRPPRRSRTVRKAQPPSPPREPVEEPPKPAAPLPQLEQILTPEQRREANRVIDQCAARVQQVLAAFHNRTLTAEQTTALARIRAFLEQAQQTRGSDLLTARALAERAAVLAEDLLKTIP